MEKKATPMEDFAHKYPSISEVKAVFSPMQLLKVAFKIKTPRDSFLNKGLTLNQIEKIYGTDETANYIAIWFQNINENLNRKKITDSQIEEISINILMSYHMLTIFDLHVICNMAKRGEFGIIYNGLDTFAILNWFVVYYDQKLNIQKQFVQDKYKNHDPIAVRLQFLMKGIEEGKLPSLAKMLANAKRRSNKKYSSPNI